MHIVDAWTIDTFLRGPDSLRFTRSDRRTNGVNLSRLDRFYVSTYLRQWGGQIGILAGTSFSDHSLVSLEVLGRKLNGQAVTRMLDSVIQDSSLKEQVNQLWNSFGGGQRTVPERFMQILSHTRDLFCFHSREKYRKYVKKEKALRYSLASLQRLQEQNPACSWTKSRLQQGRREIQEMDQSRVDFINKERASEWINVGDRVTKQFFNIVQPRFRRLPIQALREEDGRILTDEVGMRRIATKYYRKLLTTELLTDEVLAARQEIWGHVKKIVSDSMNSELTAQITEIEVHDVVQYMSKSCFPGEDGFTITFFQTYWDILATPLCMTCNSIFQSGESKCRRIWQQD